MALQQVKTYTSIQYIDQLTHLKGVSDEQIVRSFQFTNQLRDIVLKLINSIASGGSAWAIAGEQGFGKSHLLAVVRSLANQPSLVKDINNSEISNAFKKALKELPVDGVSTLMVGFNASRGIDYLKVYPKESGLSNSIRGWDCFKQLDELIEHHHKNSSVFALFLDGLSSLLRQRRDGEIFEWLQSLVLKAVKDQFCLILSLDQDLLQDQDGQLPLLKSLFSIEYLSRTNFIEIINAKVFKKSLAQQKLLEALYQDIKLQMPHFSGSKEEFIKLYPIHPLLLELSPVVRKYTQTFSLLGFVSSISGRVMIRRSSSLICADDLFENFEFELRKHPQLQSLFEVYNQFIDSIVPKLDQQDYFYARMLLKSLLIMSLANRPSTTAELADAVMLYDDRYKGEFLQMLSSIMQELVIRGEGITTYVNDRDTRYQFKAQSQTEANEEFLSQLQLLHQAYEASHLEHDPANDLGLTPDMAENETPTDKNGYINWLTDKAAQIPDNDPRLDQQLIVAGKKRFKDWPFFFESDGSLRDRAELNINWRGSLRKGVFSIGGSLELDLTPEDISNAQVINENDWQVRIFPISTPGALFPARGVPPTLIYWSPAELTDEEWTMLKILLVLHSEPLDFMSEEDKQQFKTVFENGVLEIFSRVYLEDGILTNSTQSELRIDYQSSALIAIILTRLMDKPLSARYPKHPRFEELLDAEHVNELLPWLFASETTPTPDQQSYIEAFLRPLRLVKYENEKYRVSMPNTEDTSMSAIVKLLSEIERMGTESLPKNAAYKAVRVEPFGLKSSALLLLLATLAAQKLITLVDESGDPLHSTTGLYAGAEIGDFSAIYTATGLAMKQVSWKKYEKKRSRPASGDYEKYTVLIADDDKDIMASMEVAAKWVGCRVEKASDGIEALAKLSQNPKIDLIVSDMRMPNMDGVDLFYQLKTSPGLRDIPFVVLTSIDTDEEIAAALESGVEDYWIKPFRVQEVIVRMKKLLRSRSAPMPVLAPNTEADIDEVEEPTITEQPAEQQNVTANISSNNIVQKPLDNAVNMERKTVFTTTLTASTAPDLRELYNNYLASSARNGKTEIMEFDEFQKEVSAKIERLKKQFKCDEMAFTVETERGDVNVYCQVIYAKDPSKKRPKFPVF